MLKKLSFSLFLILTQASGLAQLGNLWTQQVGIEGALLGGTLIAANSNDAGIYYNPASLSSDSSSSLAINTAVFRSQGVWFNDAFGPGTKLNQTSSNFESPFISLSIPLKNKFGVKLGAGTFSRYNVNYDFLNRIVLNDPFPELGHQQSRYEGLYNYRIKSTEQWLLFSTSRRFNNKLSFGISYIIALRNFDYSNSEKAKYIFKISDNEQTTNAEFLYETQAKLFNVKAIIKIGGLYQINSDNRIGITITTPSFSLYSNAQNYRTISQTNIYLLLDSAIASDYPDYLISNYANKLKGHYKNPLSIALGYEKKMGNNLWRFSIEYYGEIKPYALINGKNQKENLINTTIDFNNETFLDLIFAQREIVNFAVGYSGEIKKNLLLMSGFRTNFSTTKNVKYTTSESFIKVNDLKVNQFFLSGGLSFFFKQNRFTLGTDIGFNYNQNQDNLVNFNEPLVVNNQNVPLRGNIESIMQTTVLSIGFIFGYSLSF